MEHYCGVMDHYCGDNMKKKTKNDSAKIEKLVDKLANIILIDIGATEDD